MTTVTRKHPSRPSDPALETRGDNHGPGTQAGLSTSKHELSVRGTPLPHLVDADDTETQQ